MKISPYPFTVSASLFGIVALIAAILYSLIMRDSLLRSDDPYIIGLVMAVITLLATLTYLLLKELELKWLNPNYCATIYYVFLSVYCLFIEYIGGEASGYGYFFLSAIAMSFPAFIVVVYFPVISKFKKYGFLAGALYFTGYIYVLSSRM